MKGGGGLGYGGKGWEGFMVATSEADCGPAQPSRAGIGRARLATATDHDVEKENVIRFTLIVAFFLPVFLTQRVGPESSL